jgi:hypothetical protein
MTNPEISYDLLERDFLQMLKKKEAVIGLSHISVAKRTGSIPRGDDFTATRTAIAVSRGFEGGDEFATHVGSAIDLALNSSVVLASLVYQFVDATTPRPFLYSAEAREGFLRIVGGKPWNAAAYSAATVESVWNTLVYVYDDQVATPAVASLIRAEKLMELVQTVLEESCHCGGPPHSFIEEVRKGIEDGLDPWKDNSVNLSEEAAILLLDRLRARTGFESKMSMPRNFETFAWDHPTHDGFWLIVLWKASRLETALHEILRGMLSEAWSCPARSEPPEPKRDEIRRDWDFEACREGEERLVPRGSENPGRGHPGIEPLGKKVYERELIRLACTSSGPVTWSTMGSLLRDLPEESDLDTEDWRFLSTAPGSGPLGSGGLFRFRRTFENQKKNPELPTVSKLLKNHGVAGIKGNHEQLSIVEKFYGGQNRAKFAVLREFFPILQPLRVTDMAKWWKTVEPSSPLRPAARNLEMIVPDLRGRMPWFDDLPDEERKALIEREKLDSVIPLVERHSLGLDGDGLPEGQTAGLEIAGR